MIGERLLQVLRDVPGVSGSFVVARSGELALLDMPEAFDHEALALTARRVVRLLACSSANGLDPEESLLDFGAGRLFVREFVRGYLCVLCEPLANLKSLRLTARLVARAMPAEIGAAEPLRSASTRG
jgi:predicted regulator of Ras-like GTPase activity (Roadblock/LC7/MglB family)